MKYRVGFHVSIRGGLHLVFERARALSCTTLQLFTSNPRTWKAKVLRDEEVELFKQKKRTHPIDPVISHISYLPNFASSDGEIYRKSINALIEELKRCERLDIPYLVVHPGKPKHGNVASGIRRIAKALDMALEEGVNGITMVLLETTAGQGSEIGSRLEELRDIIACSKYPERLGVCVDTAHIFQAGYPIHHREGLIEFLERLNTMIGLEKLKVVHLNDSKTPFSSRVDRHWHIGEGEIGYRGFKIILSNPVIRALPLIMETPWGVGWDRKNMERVLALLSEC